MRNGPADSRTRLDTNHLTTTATNTSQASSIPPSPAASYGGKAPDFQYRNPAFDPRATAARVFGGSPQYEISNPAEHMRAAAPPKPVGFTYNPRDLRNAMLNRAAAESAAAASASRGQSPAPASAAGHQISQPFGNAVELPAAMVMSPVSHRPSYETLERGSTASRASDNSKTTSATGATSSGVFTDFQLPDPEPVELSADPASHAPPPLAESSPAPFNRPDLAVRENITMPVVEPPRTLRPAPPPPPKDVPGIETRAPRHKQSADLLVKDRNTPVENLSSPRAETNAPVIGKLPGLEESGKGLDLELTGPAGQDEEKPPAWL
jgi:hypothetical protein